jgi:hypothetical protein
VSILPGVRTAISQLEYLDTPKVGADSGRAGNMTEARHAAIGDPAIDQAAIIETLDR